MPPRREHSAATSYVMSYVCTLREPWLTTNLLLRQPAEEYCGVFDPSQGCQRSQMWPSRTIREKVACNRPQCHTALVEHTRGDLQNTLMRVRRSRKLAVSSGEIRSRFAKRTQRQPRGPRGAVAVQRIDFATVLPSTPRCSAIRLRLSPSARSRSASRAISW